MRGYDEIKAEINDLEGRISRPSTSDLDGILNARMWALKWVLREGEPGYGGQEYDEDMEGNKIPVREE